MAMALAGGGDVGRVGVRGTCDLGSLVGELEEDQHDCAGAQYADSSAAASRSSRNGARTHQVPARISRLFWLVGAAWLVLWFRRVGHADKMIIIYPVYRSRHADQHARWRRILAASEMDKWKTRCSSYF